MNDKRGNRDITNGELQVIVINWLLMVVVVITESSENEYNLLRERLRVKGT